MKKYGKSLSFLLVMALLLSLLTACSFDPTITTRSPVSMPIIGSTEATTDPTEPPVELHLLTVPAELDNPDNLPVLTWVCHARCKWSDKATQNVNKALAEREMPFRLQFISIYTNLPDAGYIDNLCNDPRVPQEILAAVENADLLFSGFDDEDKQNYLMPITEYVHNSLANIVPHEVYWEGTSVDGEVYGVPTRAMTAMTDGWILYNDAANIFGFDAEDLHRPFWEADDILAQIYKANGNKPFIAMTEGGLSIGNQDKDYAPGALLMQIDCYYELIGSCFAIDHRSGTPRIINYLDTDYTRKCQAAMQRYQRAGYFLSNDRDEHYLMNWSVYADDIYQAQYDSRTAIKETMIPCNTPYVMPFKSAYGITKNSQHKEEALMLLELLANDQAFLELVLYGDQAVDKSCNTKAFLSAYHELFDSEKNKDHHIAYPAKEQSTVLETHRQLIDNAIIFFNVRFDFSSVQKETDAVNAVLHNYLTNFTALSEAEYNQMLSEIKKAGGDTILNELQSQLDAWLAKHKKG